MTYQITGLVLALVSLAWLMEPIQALELKLSQKLQGLANRQPWILIFQEIWFLGRTTLAIIILAVLISYRWKMGLTAAAVYLLIAGIEVLIKITFNRKRPFEVSSPLAMLQPLKPADASYPSGDSLRIWYLALILSSSAGNSPYLLAMLILTAVLVTAGRLIMGVHYLTDTLAGAGLGFLGAGTTIWIWQMLGLV